MIGRAMEVGDGCLGVTFSCGGEAFESLCTGIETCLGFGHDGLQLKKLSCFLFLLFELLLDECKGRLGSLAGTLVRVLLL